MALLSIKSPGMSGNEIIADFVQIAFVLLGDLEAHNSPLAAGSHLKQAEQ